MNYLRYPYGLDHGPSRLQAAGRNPYRTIPCTRRPVPRLASACQLPTANSGGHKTTSSAAVTFVYTFTTLHSPSSSQPTISCLLSAASVPQLPSPSPLNTDHLTPHATSNPHPALFCCRFLFCYSRSCDTSHFPASTTVIGLSIFTSRAST